MNNQYPNQYPNTNPYANNQQNFVNQPPSNNQYPRPPPPPPPQNPYNQFPPGQYHPIAPLPNQGYIPPNQVFPQNQGYLPVGGQGYIINGHMCPFCRRETGNIQSKQPGGVTWIWCFALFLCTGLCCCIPFCVDSCKDTVVVCQVCQGVKGRIEANCC